EPEQDQEGHARRVPARPGAGHGGGLAVEAGRGEGVVRLRVSRAGHVGVAMRQTLRDFRRALGRGRAALHRWTGVRSQRGQAMVETVLLTILLIGWGSAMMYFFP